nr:FtsQ-type POTRA domain-containing protein [Clostridium saccharobutylicum]
MQRVGRYMIKSSNKLILKARRKKRIRRVIWIFVILIIGGIIFVTKSNFFVVKKVAILGNPIMSGEDIKKKTENLIGQNIFFINKSNILNEAKKNPYIDGIEISKVYPKQVNIKIAEKQGVYCTEKDGQYYVFSNKGVLLEKTNNIENRNLINIKGINLSDGELGEEIVDNDRILSFLEVFQKIVDINPTNYNIESIDLSDLMNIRVYIGDIEGRIGNDENIPNKMNKLLHIIESPEIGIKSGYVDVGFDGSPIYYSK